MSDRTVPLDPRPPPLASLMVKFIKVQSGMKPQLLTEEPERQSVMYSVNTECNIVQGIIHPKRKILAEFTVFKNSLTFFLLWKTKDILRNVTTAFVHTMKVNGFQNNFGLHWLHWQDFPPKSIYFWKVWDNNYIFFMFYFFWVNCSFMTDICYIQMEYDYIYKYVYMHSIQFDTFKILSCTLPFKSLGARRCVFERSY